MNRDTGLSSDSRGVSEVVGFVLIFGIIVILLAINQAQVVPAENEEVEFRHNDQVKGQLQELRNAILETAGTGNTQPVSVSLGTQFPPRVVAINPPPVYGRLETRAVGSPPVVTVANARAIDVETEDYWNGTTRNFSTKSLMYQGEYRVLTGAPNATIYETSLLYNRFDNGATLPVTSQLIVRNNTITLVVLNGSVSTSGTDSVTLEPRTISGPTQPIAIENDVDGEPINITVPASIDAATFTNITDLPAEVLEVTDAPGENRIRISLRPGSYALRMAKVGFGNTGMSEGAHYITLVDRPQSTVQTGTEHDITVEVRDQFNNPITGFVVNASATEGSFVSNKTKTGADGQADFTYRAPSTSATAVLNLTIFDGEPGRENVTFTVEVVQPGTGGDGGAYAIAWTDPTQSGVVCDPPNDPNGVCTVDASKTREATLIAETDPTVDDATVDFAVNNSTVGAVSPKTNTTNDAGQSATSFLPKVNGEITVFTSSGGSGDQLEVKVVNASAGDFLGEVGRVTIDQNTAGTWRTVPLEGSYENPVVIAKPLEFRTSDTDPAYSRIRNVETASFEIRVDEWPNQDGAHGEVNVTYLVFEEGTHDLTNGSQVDVGTVTLSDNTYQTVAYNQSFASTPVVFSQSQTINDDTDVVTRQQGVGAAGFDVKLQESEGDGPGGHGQETVGYIAIEVNQSINNGTRWETGRTPNAVEGVETYGLDPTQFYDQAFSQSYADSPALIAQMQTEDGPNTAWERYGDLNTANFGIAIDEETTGDSERDHTTETVGFFAFGGTGPIYENGSVAGGSGGGSGNSNPTVKIDDATHTPTGQSGKYNVDVTFTGSDPDGNLQSYTVTLYNTNSKTNSVDSDSSNSYTGGQVTITLSDTDPNSFTSPFWVEVVVTDSQGAQANDEQGT